ncbi:DUF3885 domain-containing protein [Sporosarcina sp. Te-1]|uniref:DUF3885 domain-containing protein n=1 Tax=Sporosarcina sp. Te-1 TaxID=2818390 RepID=UPI001FB16D9D|nr:DUF3885 domain-containing protein [Sporosarcina sp. Te-1]
MVDQLMREHFNGLTLRPPLFYSWYNGIRFEISMPWANRDDCANSKQIEERVVALFSRIFQEEDDLLLITDIHCERKDYTLRKKPTKVYQKYVKEKNVRRKLRHTVMTSVFADQLEEENVEDQVTHRFTLACKKRDIRCPQLLSAITYEDFAHPTQILKGRSKLGIDIYFINLTTKMIFHLYDDRGCDVIAANLEELRPLYNSFNGWILDYDRERIEELMSGVGVKRK